MHVTLAFHSVKVYPHWASASVSPLEYIVMLENWFPSVTMYSNGNADARCGQTFSITNNWVFHNSHLFRAIKETIVKKTLECCLRLCETVIESYSFTVNLSNSSNSSNWTKTSSFWIKHRIQYLRPHTQDIISQLIDGTSRKCKSIVEVVAV